MKKAVDKLYWLLCVIMVVFMAAMTIMVFTNTLLRYTTKSSIIASEEISRFLFVWCIFIGGIIALADDIHIKVDLLTQKLPAAAQKFLLLLVYVSILAISVILASGGWTQTVINMRNYAPATDIPLSFQNVSCFICGVGMILVSLARIAQIFVPGLRFMSDKPEHKEGGAAQ